MDTTIEYYNTHAEQYTSDTINADMSYIRSRFLSYLHPGARILDAGCGSGRDALAFLLAGYQVDAFDASEKMCRIASQNVGISVAQMRFEDISGIAEYDGIWACASLLHVPAQNMVDVLHRFYMLLKPGGVLYASYKYGNGERIQNGRRFSDYTEITCRSLLERCGFEILDLFVTEDVRQDRKEERWVNCLACSPVL